MGLMSTDYAWQRRIIHRKTRAIVESTPYRRLVRGFALELLEMAWSTPPLSRNSKLLGSLPRNSKVGPWTTLSRGHFAVQLHFSRRRAREASTMHPPNLALPPRPCLPQLVSLPGSIALSGSPIIKTTCPPPPPPPLPLHPLSRPRSRPYTSEHHATSFRPGLLGCHPV